jgi:hypothetical protein
MDAGEPGLPGWTLRLIQDGNEIANTVTDELGGYRFSDLAPGSYVVLEDLQPECEWNQTAPGGGWYEITLTDKDARRYDFGNYNGSTDRLLAEFERPLMRPSPEQMKKWIEEYEAAPIAPLDPNIGARLEAEPLGGYFSLLGHLQYTPSERDQGYCGDCWAWAGTGVMEIGLDVQRSVKDRFSIQYLNSNYNEGSGEDWACCGGWLSDVANFYSATDKAIPWTNANAHWQDGGQECGELPHKRSRFHHLDEPKLSYNLDRGPVDHDLRCGNGDGDRQHKERTKPEQGRMVLLLLADGHRVERLQ